MKEQGFTPSKALAHVKEIYEPNAKDSGFVYY